jgi:hypothetical protein
VFESGAVGDEWDISHDHGDLGVSQSSSSSYIQIFCIPYCRCLCCILFASSSKLLYERSLKSWSMVVIIAKKLVGFTLLELVSFYNRSALYPWIYLNGFSGPCHLHPILFSNIYIYIW